jgi:urease accessory protein
VATVTLGFDDRHRRRIRLTDDAGADFLLDLPEAATLVEGDGLGLEGGGIIAVRAADEDVIDVRAEPALLARLAWHLGNRHLPVAFGPDHLRIRADHVIADMLAGLGARVERRRAPFTPEPGAYAQRDGHHDHAHGHDHHHEHGHHHHAHGHDHGHDHDHADRKSVV